MTLARTPLAAFGVVLTTACALLFLLALVVESFGFIRNPYVGILVFGALPAGFALGLLLIAIGNLRGRRRGAAEVSWPTIDLKKRGQRVFVMGLLAASIVNVVILSLAGYGAVHYMETPEFCGLVCHSVMEPEYVSHAAGPHANITCVSCHVGSGTDALVRSKLDGTRRLAGFITGNITRPIPTPVQTMRPARHTCGTCHWPEKIHGDRLKVVREFADDETSTETVTTLELKVGGGSAALGIGEGIHWHMNVANQVEFIALDPARQDIPYVKLTMGDGTVREFRRPGVTDATLAGGTRRQMDCTDCHSRPSHAFAPSAERAADAALALDPQSRSLPFARREVVRALKTEAPSKDEALTAIDAGLRAFYSGSQMAARPADADIDRVVRVTKALYASNVFPQMKITWGSYRNELGHIDSPGCFRCHDEEKATEDGRTISQDCESCHRMR
ncbi:MAG: NapC/NirT family cytochrome c [Acidobacteria bacterium]|nr:NapC/NirT family cytochrome c [Acidobacteriota bacterium]